MPAGGSEQPPPHGERKALHRDGDETADQQGSREGGGGRIWRVRAFGQQGGPEPASQEGADGEASEAQHPYDQPLLIAPEGHGQGEGNDQPVEAGHGFPNTSVRVTTFARVNPPVTRSRQPSRENQPPRRPAGPQREPLSERQRRLRQRALPLAVVGLIAFVFGAISS